MCSCLGHQVRLLAPGVRTVACAALAEASELQRACGMRSFTTLVPTSLCQHGLNTPARRSLVGLQPPLSLRPPGPLPPPSPSPLVARHRQDAAGTGRGGRVRRLLPGNQSLLGGLEMVWRRCALHTVGRLGWAPGGVAGWARIGRLARRDVVGVSGQKLQEVALPTLGLGALDWGRDGEAQGAGCMACWVLAWPKGPARRALPACCLPAFQPASRSRSPSCHAGRRSRWPRNLPPA